MPMEYYQLAASRPGFLGGGTWELSNLSPITVIFGRNGSGKSILLRAIRDKNKALHHYCVPERAGEIQFEAQQVANELDAEQRASRASQNANPSYRQDIITRIVAYFQKRGSTREPIDGNDLILIEKYINLLMTEFSFSIKEGNPPFILKRLPNGPDISNVSQMSSGEIQLLTLGLDLLLVCSMWKFSRQRGILLIDEPDQHFHPDLQQRFAKFLVDLQMEYGCKMIISTHSTVMLSSLGYHGTNLTSVIYLDKKLTHKARLFNEVLKKLSSCLGGHALMGPLFDFPLLLVEGDDDYKIWSEVPRHEPIKISVIPCNGEEIFGYQKSLEGIFTSILDPSGTPRGYALLDNDKNIPGSEQNQVKFIRLNCRESENLYLSDEILKSMGLNWDQACDRVTKSAPDFLSKKDYVKDISSWDRRTVDCKSVINEIARVLDDKNLPWTYRLGKELGKNKPVGQLADFLGDEVIKAIWA